MSDGERRNSFAVRATASNVRQSLRAADFKATCEYSSKVGSRLYSKKVPQNNYLSRALLRSSFGRSED